MASRAHSRLAFLRKCGGRTTPTDRAREGLRALGRGLHRLHRARRRPRGPGRVGSASSHSLNPPKNCWNPFRVPLAVGRRPHPGAAVGGGRRQHALPALRRPTDIVRRHRRPAAAAAATAATGEKGGTAWPASFSSVARSGAISPFCFGASPGMKREVARPVAPRGRRPIRWTYESSRRAQRRSMLTTRSTPARPARAPPRPSPPARGSRRRGTPRAPPRRHAGGHRGCPPCDRCEPLGRRRPEAPPLRSIFLSHVALRFFSRRRACARAFGQRLDQPQLLPLVRRRLPDPLRDALDVDRRGRRHPDELAGTPWRASGSSRGKSPRRAECCAAQASACDDPADLCSKPMSSMWSASPRTR